MAEMKWIGLAEVVPGSQNEALVGRGAFVNVVGVAESPGVFAKVVASAVATMDLFLVGLEDVEEYAQRASRLPVEERLRAGAESLSAEGEVVFGDFHAFPLERH